MHGVNTHSQSGFALLIFVVIMMGIGGIVLVGYSQGILKQVETSKFKHNQRVLKEAKQALLQYAYNYPVNTPGRGPGRLPCPDTDNNGSPNPSFNCVSGTAMVGRFPWGDTDMNLYEVRDADEEILWYAVSSNFANQISPASDDKINSDTVGTITLVDQTQNIIYDGNVAGIAAVIIAPGSALAGQDRIAGPNNPANFLDSVNGFDNSVFNNGESDTNEDGFILGPVFDQVQNINVVNDQIIVITAAEVIEVAEKATLQAYRNSLQAYDQRIDTDVAAGDYYPWLFNFTVNDYGGGYPELDEYPSQPVFATEWATSLGRNGRIPSMFTDYFTETETDGRPIESRLRVDLTLDYPISPATVGFNQAFAKCPSNPAINCSNGVLDFDAANDRVFNILSTDPLNQVNFIDIGPAGFGRLTGNYVSNDSATVVRYFWDEEPVGNGWRECQAGGNSLSDCNRDSSGNPDPGEDNDTPSQILRVQIDLNLTGTVNFDMDYATAPVPVVAVVNSADGGQHANISATFTGANLANSTLPVVVSYQYDSFYDTTFDIQASGTLDLADLLPGGSLALTLRYYPELPNWAISNGWHDSILMAYSSDYQPGGVGGPCTAGTDCLQINNIAGTSNDKISLLTIAGQHDWNDGGAVGLQDDVGDVFDLENEDLDDTFDVRAANGNDKILVIDEL